MSFTPFSFDILPVSLDILPVFMMMTGDIGFVLFVPLGRGTFVEPYTFCVGPSLVPGSPGSIIISSLACVVVAFVAGGYILGVPPCCHPCRWQC